MSVEEIYQFLKYPAEFPSLGRREDLANFEKVSIVEINEQKLKKDKKIRDQWHAYIPIEKIEDESISIEAEGTGLSGTRFTLPKVYELYNFGTKNKPKFKRNWVERKEVLYSSVFVFPKRVNVLMDEEEDIVFLM